jgi:putative flippase GtrA
MTEFNRERAADEVKRALRFLVVGCGGLAVDSAVFLFLHGQGVDKPMARAASLLVATGVTWLTNRHFTFDQSGQRRRVEFGRYGLVALGAQGFNYALFLSLSAQAPAIHPLPLITVSAAAAAALSYTGQRFFTFAAPAQGFSRAD